MHDINWKTDRAMKQIVSTRRANAGVRPGAARRTLSRAGYAAAIFLVAWWLVGTLGHLPTAIHPGFLLATWGAACCWLAALLLEATAPPPTAPHPYPLLVDRGRDTLGTAQRIRGDSRMTRANVLAAPAPIRKLWEKQHAEAFLPDASHVQHHRPAAVDTGDTPIELRFADLARMSPTLAHIVRGAIDDVPPLPSGPDAVARDTPGVSDTYHVRTTGQRYDLRILGHLADPMGRAL